MTKQDAARGIDIFAKSVYRDLKQAGYCRADIVSFASSILGHITTEAKQATAEPVESNVSGTV
jgi:hypothetical protein